MVSLSAGGRVMAPDDLRVAVVSDATRERNGVGTYYADLVQQLRGQGATAELICPFDPGSGWRRVEDLQPHTGDR